MGWAPDACEISTPSSDKVALIRHWTLEEFSASAALWNDLLARSEANPLFMSWEWQWQWWRHHAVELRGELIMLAAYSVDNRLIGLAPLYLHRAAHRVFSAMRLESIGSNWRCGGGVFSEYLDFIVDRGYANSFLAAIARYLYSDTRWSDLVFCNTKVDGLAARLATEYLRQDLYVRRVDPLVAHVARLPGSFDGYVHSLDRSVRRRVWNHRKKLQGASLIAVEDVAEGLDQLNRFHVRRWGAAHYVGMRRAFHHQFAVAMSNRQALRMTELHHEGRAISIMYNVRIGDTEYNVQSGFDTAACSGVSPGYLHFGYCIERACAEGVSGFDFLVGPGLHRDYKSDFRTTQTAMITLQAIRTPSLAWLYRQYDRRFPAMTQANR